MATVTAARAADDFPVTSGYSGQALVAWGTYEIAVALSKGDIIEFCKLPKGAVVLGGRLYGDDIDTGTEELEIDIGTASDPDMFLNSGVLSGDAVAEVVPQAGINIALGGTLQSDGPTALAADTTIIGTITAAAKAGGTGTLSLYLLYTMSMTTG
jgi:hypothetical protein